MIPVDEGQRRWGDCRDSRGKEGKLQSVHVRWCGKGFNRVKIVTGDCVL